MAFLKNNAVKMLSIDNKSNIGYNYTICFD